MPMMQVLWALSDVIALQAEEINAQAPPMGPAAGPRQADVPGQAGLRRTASAPVPDVPGGADVATTISDAIFLGMNAAIQQDQVTPAVLKAASNLQRCCNIYFCTARAAFHCANIRLEAFKFIIQMDCRSS